MLYELLLRGEGKAWPLSDEALVIGSGDACTIRLREPGVSRVHCKIATATGGVRLESLDPHNPVLLDHKPVSAAEARPGNKIGVGNAIFEVAERGETIATAKDAELASVNVSRALAEFVRQEEAIADPNAIREIQVLFTLGSDLGAAAGHVELMAALARAVAKALSPEVAWWISLSGRGRHLVHRLTGELEASPPSEWVRHAIDANAGLLVTRPIRRKKTRWTESTLVVPVSVDKRPLGALAASRTARGRAFSQRKLLLLGAIAQTFAPHWRAAFRVDQLQRDCDHLRDELGDTAGIVGTSPALKVAMDQADRIADTALSVFLLGESGTGKELIARRIHDRSRRCTGPFVTVNCAAIPPALFESELFGHEAGAFAGATKQRRGKLEEAHGGTFFLDEVPDLQPENQLRLLRAMETGSFRRVGGHADITVDVRYVAATNKDLDALIEENLFREDLFRRLGGWVIHHPPLRERRDDIPVLTQWFVERWARREAKASPGISPAALDRLAQWHWPGNVRELRMCVERAVILAAGEEIQPEHILLGPSGTVPSAPIVPFDPRAVRPLAEVEADHIRNVVRQCDGNLRAAAKALGIARATLYRKLAQDAYGIDRHPG